MSMHPGVRMGWAATGAHMTRTDGTAGGHGADAGRHARGARRARDTRGTERRGPVAAFLAGAAGVLTTHQAVLWALHAAGAAPWPAYSLAPTRPFGVPAVASAAFWGGAWWAALAPWLPRDRGAGAYYARAALLGAVLPNVLGAILAALGGGRSLGETPRALATLSAVVVNGAWGATAAALLRR
jgi:hypothetical protein